MLLEESTVDLADLARLAQLFEEHRPKLLAMVAWRSSRALAGRRDPEDLLHQAYLKAQERWDDFRASGMTAYAWLYRLVRDCLLDDYDRQTTRGRSVRREVAWPERSSEQMVLGLVGNLTNPSDALARKEFLERVQQRVQQTLDLLAPEFREVLYMHFFDQLNQKEIAEVLGIGHAAVRQRYTRARLRFRDLWKQMFGEEGVES